jgi:hypothetical protein
MPPPLFRDSCGDSSRPASNLEDTIPVSNPKPVAELVALLRRDPALLAQVDPERFDANRPVHLVVDSSVVTVVQIDWIFHDAKSSFNRRPAIRSSARLSERRVSLRFRTRRCDRLHGSSREGGRQRAKGASLLARADPRSELPPIPRVSTRFDVLSPRVVWPRHSRCRP